MLNLQRVTMFIAVVDAGSFTQAAAALGQTKAVVSFNVRQLENELGGDAAAAFDAAFAAH